MAVPKAKRIFFEECEIAALMLQHGEGRTGTAAFLLAPVVFCSSPVCRVLVSGWTCVFRGLDSPKRVISFWFELWNYRKRGSPSKRHTCFVLQLLFSSQLCRKHMNTCLGGVLCSNVSIFLHLTQKEVQPQVGQGDV